MWQESVLLQQLLSVDVSLWAGEHLSCLIVLMGTCIFTLTHERFCCQESRRNMLGLMHLSILGRWRCLSEIPSAEGGPSLYVDRKRLKCVVGHSSFTSRSCGCPTVPSPCGKDFFLCYRGKMRSIWGCLLCPLLSSFAEVLAWAGSSAMPATLEWLRQHPWRRGSVIAVLTLHNAFRAVQISVNASSICMMLLSVLFIWGNPTYSPGSWEIREEWVLEGSMVKGWLISSPLKGKWDKTSLSLHKTLLSSKGK